MTLTEIQSNILITILECLTKPTFLYCEGGVALEQGLQLFDDEWLSICLGQERAAQLAEQDQQSAWCCTRYAGYGASILHVGQHPAEQIRWAGERHHGCSSS